MRITGAEVFEYVRRLDGRSWNPVSRWTERRAPLVLLHTDDGLTGIGEAWSKQDEIGLVLAALARALERVVGNELRDAGTIATLAHERSGDDWATWATWAAASAIDMALWDLLAQSRGESLWKTLGGTSGSVPVYASGGLYRDGATVDDLVAEVAQHRAAGFGDIKMKVGGMRVATDLARIDAARAAMDDSGELWVDAVNQLDPRAAPDTALAYRGAGAAALQAPVAFDDYPTMARINRDALPVIAAESEFSRERHERLLATGSVGLLQFNLGLCGGFAGATELSALAAARAVRVTPQVHATAVLQAASLHFGAATANVRNVEFHRFHDHLAHLLGDGLLPATGGRIVLSDRPGLGIGMPAPGPQPDSGVIRIVAKLG